jgi:hypothetical protein
MKDQKQNSGIRDDKFTWGKDDIKFIPPEENKKQQQDNKNK